MDLHSYQIKNELVLFGILFVLSFHGYQSGIYGVIESMLGIFFSIVILFPIFLLRGLGAGDIKLCSIFTGFITLHNFQSLYSNVSFLVVAILLGAMLSIFKIIFLYNKQLLSCFHFLSFFSHFFPKISVKKSNPISKSDQSSRKICKIGTNKKSKKELFFIKKKYAQSNQWNQHKVEKQPLDRNIKNGMKTNSSQVGFVDLKNLCDIGIQIQKAKLTIPFSVPVFVSAMLYLGGVM